MSYQKLLLQADWRALLGSPDDQADEDIISEQQVSAQNAPEMSAPIEDEEETVEVVFSSQSPEAPEGSRGDHQRPTLRRVSNEWERLSDADLAKVVGDAAVHGQLNLSFFWEKYVNTHYIIYFPPEKTLYAYNGVTGVWEPLDDVLATRRLEEFGRRALKMRRWDAGLIPLARNLRSGLEAVRRAAHRKDWSWGGEGILHFKNTMLDIRTLEVMGFSPDYRSRSVIPFEWQPFRKSCPQFMQLLSAADGGEADIKLLLRYIGQCLSGVNQTQKFLLLTGAGGVGKNTLVSVIQKLVGESLCDELRLDQVNRGFEIGAYSNKSLLCAAEIEEDFMTGRAGNRLRSMVGDDLLSVEFKGSNQRESRRGNWNIIASTNETPKVNFKNDAARKAWARRLLVVNFSIQNHRKPILNFADKIVREEGEAIIVLAVEAYSQLLAEFDEAGWPVSEDQQARIDAIIDGKADVGGWAAKRLVLSRDGDITTEEAFEDYFAWCKEFKVDAQSRLEFSKSLKGLLLSRYRASESKHLLRDDKHRRGYKGVALAPSAEGVSENQEVASES